MAAKNPNRCSLCYTNITDTDTEQITLTTRTLSLCPTCSNQADQISNNTGASRQAAIAYMVELIFSALTSSASPQLPRPSSGTKDSTSQNHST